MLKITVYKLDKDGERRDVRSVSVEPGEDREADFYGLGSSFPPCSCPACRPRPERPR